MGREAYSQHIRRVALTRTIREHFSSERRNRFSDRVIELWEARHARGAQAPRPRANAGRSRGDGRATYPRLTTRSAEEPPIWATCAGSTATPTPPSKA